MGTVLNAMNAEQFAELYGKDMDSVRIKLRRIMPGVPFDRTRELSADVIQRLLDDGRKKEQAKPAPKKRAEVARQLLAETPAQVRQEVVSKRTPEKPNRIRRALLISLLIAPTAASITNMFHVTREITGEPITAALYTVVLSVTALGFTLAGIRSWLTVLLAVVLIGYESFCNLSRLYYGLMGGTSGNPTRFLGTVTDIFGSGSHGTAIVIAGFSAAMLAAVQYSAIFELNKR